MKNITFLFLFFALTATAQQGINDNREKAGIKPIKPAVELAYRPDTMPRKWVVIPIAVMIPQPVRPMRRVIVHRKIKAI
jgi:hypothetical protein